MVVNQLKVHLVSNVNLHPYNAVAKTSSAAGNITKWVVASGAFLQARADIQAGMDAMFEAEATK